MSTKIKPQVSKKNPYWIERHRYYELKHFCMQYPIWEKAYKAVDSLSHRPWDAEVFAKNQGESITEKAAEQAQYYAERMRMVEDCCYEASSIICGGLILGVTRGLTYEQVLQYIDIPCGREYYYETYRKFFWILNRVHY